MNPYLADIPVVDMKKFSLTKKKDDIDSVLEQNVAIAENVAAALDDIGFVYLVNHGIDKKQIQEAFNQSASFFDLSEEIKQKYTCDPVSGNGWYSMETEGLDPTKPGDCKEVYVVRPKIAKVWPDEDVPSLKPALMKLHNSCLRFSSRVLELLAIGLNLEEDYFAEGHIDCDTTLRSMYYPPIPKEFEIKPGQLRCGEHTDDCSFTLLFQDDAGGFEVCNTNGEYIHVTPVPDSILVNVGDMMQRWTADRLAATRHRVVFPEDDAGRSRSRRSIEVQVSPNVDYVIRCIDGSDKYEPITWGEHLKSKLHRDEK